MALIVRLLNTGFINTATTTALYTVPTTVLGAVVRNVRVVNINTGPGSTLINLYFTPSGGSQVRILDQNYPINNTDILVFTPELTMGPSDKIELVTTGTGMQLEFVVSGVEQQ